MFPIQEFLLDEAFLALDRHLHTFNVFDVLNLKEFEIRHTRFLAHMLDPNETHGMGTNFLRNFLLHVSAQLPEAGQGSPAPSLLDDIHQLDLELARVTAELSIGPKSANPSAKAVKDDKDRSGRLDLLLRIPHRRGHIVSIAIENKINAKESGNQLERYHGWMEKEFGMDRSLLLYLTVADEEVASPWLGITYSNVVYPALETTRQTAGSTPGNGPALLIEHYMAALRDKVEAEAAYADADRLAEELLLAYKGAQHAIESLRAEWQDPFSRKGLDGSWGLYSRYRRTFDFLAGFAADEQTRVLRWFMQKWPETVAGKLPGTRIRLDDSNRSYMRFLPAYPGKALLTLSHDLAQKAEPDRKFPWTKGEHAVLFEIRSYALSRGQDSAEEGFQWVLYLVIGPLQGVERVPFVKNLCSSLVTPYPVLPKRRGVDHTGIPQVIAPKTVSQKFSSVFKLPFAARSLDELEQEMSSPGVLAVLENVSSLVEDALAAAKRQQAPGA
jgi:hypothetical protein